MPCYTGLFLSQKNTLKYSSTSLLNSLLSPSLSLSSLSLSLSLSSLSPLSLSLSLSLSLLSLSLSLSLSFSLSLLSLSISLSISLSSLSLSQLFRNAQPTPFIHFASLLTSCMLVPSSPSVLWLAISFLIVFFLVLIFIVAQVLNSVWCKS